LPVGLGFEINAPAIARLNSLDWRSCLAFSQPNTWHTAALSWLSVSTGSVKGLPWMNSAKASKAAASGGPWANSSAMHCCTAGRSSFLRAVLAVAGFEVLWEGTGEHGRVRRPKDSVMQSVPA
jgi:hypothetical protein